LLLPRFPGKTRAFAFGVFGVSPFGEKRIALFGQERLEIVGVEADVPTTGTGEGRGSCGAFTAQASLQSRVRASHPPGRCYGLGIHNNGNLRASTGRATFCLLLHEFVFSFYEYFKLAGTS
jgi:hypothetical protein